MSEPKSDDMKRSEEATDCGGLSHSEAMLVHPIIRQIIDRDCHVATPAGEVVKHVVSKLRHGYDTLRQMPQGDREQFVEQCVHHHRENFKEYVEVMTGFSRASDSSSTEFPQALTGKQIVNLMRKHKKTIESLAFRMGITQKRIRKIREQGLADVLAIRDWIEAITGEDPGPIPERYRIGGIQEEGSCCFCGFPLYSGDEAFEYVGSMFCSTTCCRKSRGW